MTPRLRLILGVGAITTLGVATMTGALLVRGEDWSRSDISTALVNCLNYDGNTDERAAETCMKAVLAAGAASGGIAETHLAVIDAENLNPDVSGVCHTVAHQVGRQAYHDGNDIYTALPTLTVPGCQSGLMHGMLEGWADTNPDDTEVNQLAAACEALATAPDTKDIPGVDGMCGEAIGHASWLARQSPDLCRALQTNAAREQCGVGVVMQSYLPAGQAEPLAGVTLNDLVQLCADWPDDLPVSDCQAGAAWPIVQGYRNTIGQIIRQNQGNPESDEQTRRMLQELDNALNWCAKVDTLNGAGTGVENRPCARYLIGYIEEHARSLLHAPDHCEAFGNDMNQYCRDLVIAAQGLLAQRDQT